MKLSVGNDILHINRVKKACLKGDDPFLLRIFTEKERTQAQRHSNPLIYYASRFSGKEAVCKALDLPDVKFSEIEIITLPSGRPSVVLHGITKSQAQDVNDISISLSYDNEYVVACAIAIKE